MRAVRTLLCALPLLALSAACCFAGNAPPAGPPAPTGTRLPPSPGHTCHLVADVRFQHTKDTGEPWDVGGGMPDPFLVVRQDGAEVGRTDRVQDSLSAHWEFDVECEHDRPIDIEVLDRDLSLDDHAFDYEIEPGSGFVVSPLGQTVEGSITVTRR